MSQQGTPPNQRQLPTGTIEVAPRAIASIVASSVGQSYGVVGMAPHTFREGVAQVLHQRDAHRGVDVRIGDDWVEIDVYIIVGYGMRIAEVARNVQENVRYAVERALGMPVARVNVRVQGLKN
ncbi:MAG TPA: Asp23/Gls24 family envelope stress response protein [Kouleothrix sp.]|uniref:Asp23/Gls24 family envelope stress response protein n=1 Tax=Kouleothrix sp. TaxID=2779161 RepID=UPI002BC967F4|nr:Asp23/Gls24 family envelope stress response protein [Kouleothrix sp.]HRC75299.1 Asp23/Gls24 family envelope stress response protein [Kouleothrix sp.]